MLEIKDLYKNYGSFTAVSGLNMNIEKGEIFGFVGPNGAGKTTTMKIICGLLRASGGTVLLDGIDGTANPQGIKSKIGYMPDFFGVYDDLKVMEYMDYFADIYEVPVQRRKKMIEELLELVDLGSKSNEYVDSLSRGMKQRLCLARSMVHNPSFLILDEPASGMDPRARAEMKSILRNLKDLGKTVLISSHILPELSELCTSLAIIDQGKMIIQGSFQDIMDRVYGKRDIHIKVLGQHEKTMEILKGFPQVERVSSLGDSIACVFNGNDGDMNTILAELVRNGAPVCSFCQSEGSLEDVFLKVTKGGE